MIMKSGTVLMETCGDANNTEAIEEEFVTTEEDTIDAVGLVCMTTELLPTGGRETILRFEKSVVGKTTNADQRNGIPSLMMVEGTYVSRSKLMTREMMEQSLLMTVEILPKSKLMVEVMNMSNYQTEMAVVMRLSTTKPSLLVIRVMSR